MKKVRINEVLIVQGQGKKGDSVSLGEKCLGVTIRCIQNSAVNTYVGWNEPATEKNFLQPGDNVSYNVGDIPDRYLDGNTLYVAFAPGGGGRALVSIINGMDDC